MPRCLEENLKELLGKLFYVWRKTQVRLSSNVLAFWKRCFWVFWEGMESEDFWELSLLEWDKLWMKWKFLFVLCISGFGSFVLCNWLFFVIMFVFGLILCSLEIVSRHLVAKNEITGLGLLNYRILMWKSVIWHFVRCGKFYNSKRI